MKRELKANSHPTPPHNDPASVSMKRELKDLHDIHVLAYAQAGYQWKENWKLGNSAPSALKLARRVSMKRELKVIMLNRYGHVVSDEVSMKRELKAGVPYLKAAIRASSRVSMKRELKETANGYTCRQITLTRINEKRIESWNQWEQLKCLIYIRINEKRIERTSVSVI